MKKYLSSRGARRATWRSRDCFAALAMTPFLFFAMATAFAQEPTLNLPPTPSQPVTIVFKDVTRRDLFQLVFQTVKESKRVENLVMARAQRGYIEYKGDFFGDSESFLENLNQAVAEKLKIEMKQKTAGLEILVTPQGS